MWNLWKQSSTPKHEFQNVHNSNSETGTQYNICGHNNTVSVSATQVKTDGLEVQVSEPVSSFYGREDDLERVHKALQEPHGDKRRRLVVLCGLGGIGKTQCARTYIQLYRTTYTNIIWLQCEHEQDIKSSLQNVFSHMNLSASSTPNDMYGYLNSTKTLFVFDNAQDMNSISPYLPRKESKCLFLVTSQLKNWSPYVSLELDKLDVNAAMGILDAVLGEHDIIMHSLRLEQLAQRLDRIPLVLQISAGFICQQVLDFRSMDEECNIDDIFSKLEKEYVMITAHFPSFFDSNDYLKSVYAALLRTMEKLWSRKDHLSQLAVQALGVASYLHPDELYLNDFKTVLNIEADTMLTRAWAILLNFSLVQKSYYQTFTMHRSIQQSLQWYFISNNITEYYGTTLKLLLQDNMSAHKHFPIIYEHGISYYDQILQFYSKYSSPRIFQTLIYYSNIELLELLVKDLQLIYNLKFLHSLAMAWSLNPNIVQILLHNGSDFNSVDEVGNVLHHLCNSNEYELESLFYACCVFIKHGANPKTPNAKGETAIDIARQRGHNSEAEFLEAMNPNMNNVAQLAIKHNLFVCLHYLFEHDICNMQQQDEMGNTVLHALCSSDTKWYLITSRYSRKKGVDLRIRNAAGETAADVAKRRGHLLLAELLQPGAEGPRDLYLAAKYADLEAIKKLYYLPDEYWTYRDELGRTPMHMLCALKQDTVTDREIYDTLMKSRLYKCFKMDDNYRHSVYKWALQYDRKELARNLMIL